MRHGCFRVRGGRQDWRPRPLRACTSHFSSGAAPGSPSIGSALRTLAVAQSQLGITAAAATAISAATVVGRRSQTACAGPDCERKLREDGAPLDVCIKCRRTFYCGKACQTADWKAGHRAECKSLVAEGKAAGGKL